ncbi:MAG: hypothetical protein HZC55_23970 [Verrucomicrobia bacterium]|nr:hypothetical protein [Verrucomicrobiota bacterium]
MKTRLLVVSLLWAAVIIATAFATRGEAHGKTTLSLLTAGAGASVAIFAGGDCRRRKSALGQTDAARDRGPA